MFHLLYHLNAKNKTNGEPLVAACSDDNNEIKLTHMSHNNLFTKIIQLQIENMSSGRE